MAATKCAECREEGVLPQAKQRVLLSRSAAVCALGGQVLLQPQQRQLPMLDGPLPATLGVPPIRPLWQPRMTSRCLGLLWLHRLQTLLPAEAASDPSIVRAPVLRDQKACYLRTHQTFVGRKGSLGGTLTEAGIACSRTGRSWKSKQQIASQHYNSS